MDFARDFDPTLAILGDTFVKHLIFLEGPLSLSDRGVESFTPSCLTLNSRSSTREHRCDEAPGNRLGLVIFVVRVLE